MFKYNSFTFFFQIVYIPVQALPARVFFIQVNIVYNHLLYPDR